MKIYGWSNFFCFVLEVTTFGMIQYLDSTAYIKLFHFEPIDPYKTTTLPLVPLQMQP